MNLETQKEIARFESRHECRVELRARGSMYCIRYIGPKAVFDWNFEADSEGKKNFRRQLGTLAGTGRISWFEAVSLTGIIKTLEPLPVAPLPLPVAVFTEMEQLVVVLLLGFLLLLFAVS